MNQSKDCSICVCTYKRPGLLKICLNRLLRQNSSRILEIIIIDNDLKRSAENIVQSILDENLHNSFTVIYDVEPLQNISLARNRAIYNSRGKYIAMIDDDEYPLNDDWIDQFIKVIESYSAHGVFGPVINKYPKNVPDWRKIKIFPEPGYWKTGVKVTKPRGVGNVMFKRESLFKRRYISNYIFNPEYGRTGGEDAELITWLLNQGATLVWCDEAVVCQIIEPRKLELQYHIKRNLQFGNNCTRILVEQKGFFRCIFELPIRVILGTGKIFINTLFKLKHFRLACFCLLTEMLVQIGKISYFFGVKFHIYLPKND